MLVLSRRANESLELTGGIIVTVVEVRGKQIRLGITAPPNIDVWRAEKGPLTQRQDNGRGIVSKDATAAA